MNTELVDRVAEVVKSIPSGRVMTYGEVARFVGTNALTVGRILNAHGHKFSWWRVVDASGRPYAGALERARAHFREESTPLISGAWCSSGSRSGFVAAAQADQAASQTLT